MVAGMRHTILASALMLAACGATETSDQKLDCLVGKYVDEHHICLYTPQPTNNLTPKLIGRTVKAMSMFTEQDVAAGLKGTQLTIVESEIGGDVVYDCNTQVLILTRYTALADTIFDLLLGLFMHYSVQVDGVDCRTAADGYLSYYEMFFPAYRYLTPWEDHIP